MSRSQLTALERDVEQARSRLAHDLTRLRSPATFSAFKDELTAEKDELVDKVKDATRDTTQRILNDLKDKAIANPAATLAIGSGLAWRIFRHPPIASLLVGLGVVSLLRTSPSRSSQPYMGLYDEDPAARWKDKGFAARASEVGESVKERVQEWSTQASETARERMSELGGKASAMTERASEMARTTADRASELAERASATAHRTATQISDKAAETANKVSTTLYDSIPEQETRDKLLLGTAALAVAAAVGIAYQRRQEERRQLELTD
jgi:gas vesicle protein